MQTIAHTAVDPKAFVAGNGPSDIGDSAPEIHPEVGRHVARPMWHVQTAPTICHDLIGIVAAQSAGRRAQGLAFGHGFGPFRCVGRAGAGWVRAESEMNSATSVRCRRSDRIRSGYRPSSRTSHPRDRNRQKPVGASAAVLLGSGRRSCQCRYSSHSETGRCVHALH